MLLSLIRHVKLSSAISGTSSSAESRHSHASSVSSRAANARMSRSHRSRSASIVFIACAACFQVSSQPESTSRDTEIRSPRHETSPSNRSKSLFRVSSPSTSSLRINGLRYSARTSSSAGHAASSSRISTMRNWLRQEAIIPSGTSSDFFLRAFTR